jgi:hypothetical protein
VSASRPVPAIVSNVRAARGCPDDAGLGLYHHQAHRVRHDVVDLPGDPFAFPGRRRLLRLGEAGALLQHADPVPPGPHPDPEGVGGNERQRCQAEHGRSLVEQHQHHDRHPHAGGDQDRQPPHRWRQRRDRVRGDQLAISERDAAEGPGDRQTERAGTNQPDRDNRLLAPPHQRQRRQRRQDIQRPTTVAGQLDRQRHRRHVTRHRNHRVDRQRRSASTRRRAAANPSTTAQPSHNPGTPPRPVSIGPRSAT